MAAAEPDEDLPGADVRPLSLERLEDFVDVVQGTKAESSVVQRLCDLFDVDRVRSTRILKKLIGQDEENWRVAGWVRPAMELLRKALRDEGETRRIAEETIDEFGRRGFMEFGDLLNVTAS